MRRIALIFITFLLAAAAFAATPKRAITLQNFNAGELSPQMEGRTDFPKYNSGARTLQNMLVRSQGPVTRRPGTKFIAEVKDSNDITRLIPFEYSTSDAYVLELGDDYIRFYRNGAQVLSGATAYELVSPWDANDIFEIQVAQDAQTMRLVHPDYKPRKLVRNSASHTDWTLSAITFNGGPFLDENEDTGSVVTPSATTGTITLDSNDALWNADHVGALWQVTHFVDSNAVVGGFWGAYTAGSADEEGDGTYEANSVSITIYEDQEYTVTTGGMWWGTFVIQRSYDNGTTWSTVKSFAYQGNGNVLYTAAEEEDDALYRVRMEDQGGISGHMKRHNEGICSYTLSPDAFLRHGVVQIATYVDPNEVTATVLTSLDSTESTWRWAEGAWSTYRGWPRTIEHHEQRCLYGGSASWPQTIWASITSSQDSDYDDFDPGVADAADAWTYVLPGMNPIQWMVSTEYLMVGTTDGIGRLGSPDKPISPAWPAIFRTQARNGAAYIDAIAAGDTILYVEKGSEKVREVTYTYAEDRYTAPDLTLLAEHIAKGGIVQVDFQNRPDPILWSVRNDGVLLSLTYERKHEVLAWARHITGQDTNDLTSWDDFESIAVIPGTSTKANGDSRNDDEVWAVVKRTVDGNDVRYVEQFQALDWGTDPNYCWFVDCAGYGTSAGAGDLTQNAYQYPTLQDLAPADIPVEPSAPADIALVAPIAVTDAAGLAAMTAGNHYSISNDIDLTGVPWTPLTFTSASQTVIEGNGYTISNLTVGSANANQQALIGAITGTGGGQIRNLTLDHCTITSATSSAIFCGYISESNFSFKNISITDCNLIENRSVPIDNEPQYMAMLVGGTEASSLFFYDCNAVNCTTTGDSYGGAQLGGLVGEAGEQSAITTTTFLDCAVEGGVMNLRLGSPVNIGGFIGRAYDVTGSTTQNYVFYNCSSSVAISFTSGDSFLSAKIVGMGGFVGYSANASYTGCSSTGNVTIAVPNTWTIVNYLQWVGGFLGESVGFNGLTNCYSTGTISVSGTTGTPKLDGIGGFSGFIYGDDTLLHCYSTSGISVAVTVSALLGIGGFAGEIISTALYNDPNIQRCWATGDIAFAGDITDAPVISNDGTHPSFGGIGGFAGYTTYSAGAQGVNIGNCYAWGSTSITGSYDSTCAIGGFIGAWGMDRSDVLFTNCYCAQTNVATGSSLTGQLPLLADSGGFGGSGGTTNIVTTASYYDQTTSGTTTSATGTNHVTLWMMTKTNYEAASWDFNDIWYIPTGGTNAWSGMTWAIGESECVYADGRPIDSFTVDADGVLDLNGVYSVVITGLNYYSILETMPLVDAETQGRDTNIKSFAIDFVESMGAHVGSDMTYAANQKFSDDSFATSIDPFTGYKPRTGYSGFMRPMTRKPVVYVWVYDPIPMTIRSITANLEITFE